MQEMFARVTAAGSVKSAKVSTIALAIIATENAACLLVLRLHVYK